MVKLLIGFSKPQREGKGKSLFTEIDDYVAVDLETTGLDPDFDDIIECAAIRYVAGRETERFESLVNIGYELPAFITELTGITNEMLQNAPQITDVMTKLLDFIGDSVVVGHNVNFDVNFIYDKALLYCNKTFKNNFIDTMRISRALFREYEHHRLSDLIERFFGSGNAVSHRGASDAEMAARCYEHMKEYAAGKGTTLDAVGKKLGAGVRAANITTSNTEFNEDTPIFGKTFVFTGTLSSCTRRDAMQTVVDLGGICEDGVTKKTNYLVLGNQDYRRVGDSGKSAKQKKAEAMQLQGYDIVTISESVFFDMVANSKGE